MESVTLESLMSIERKSAKLGIIREFKLELMMLRSSKFLLSSLNSVLAMIQMPALKKLIKFLTNVTKF